MDTDTPTRMGPETNIDIIIPNFLWPALQPQAPQPSLEKVTTLTGRKYPATLVDREK